MRLGLFGAALAATIGVMLTHGVAMEVLIVAGLVLWVSLIVSKAK